MILERLSIQILIKVLYTATENFIHSLFPPILLKVGGNVGPSVVTTLAMVPQELNKSRTSMYILYLVFLIIFEVLVSLL